MENYKIVLPAEDNKRLFVKKEDRIYEEVIITRIVAVGDVITYESNGIDLHIKAEDLFTMTTSDEMMQAKITDIHVCGGRYWINDDKAGVVCVNVKPNVVILFEDGYGVKKVVDYVTEHSVNSLDGQIITKEEMFDTEAFARESKTITIKNLDGSVEQKKGLLELIQLDNEQKALVAEFKNLIARMKQADIVMVGYDITDTIHLYNGRNVTYEFSDHEVDSDVFALNYYNHCTSESVTLPNGQWLNDDIIYNLKVVRK